METRDWMQNYREVQSFIYLERGIVLYDYREACVLIPHALAKYW